MQEQLLEALRLIKIVCTLLRITLRRPYLLPLNLMELMAVFKPKKTLLMKRTRRMQRLDRER